MPPRKPSLKTISPIAYQVIGKGPELNLATVRMIARHGHLRAVAKRATEASDLYTENLVRRLHASGYNFREIAVVLELSRSRTRELAIILKKKP